MKICKFIKRLLHLIIKKRSKTITKDKSLPSISSISYKSFSNTECSSHTDLNLETLNFGHSACFLMKIQKKGHKRNIILPVNLNLDKLIIDNPPLDNGFHSKLAFNIEKAYYFLSLLTTIPARNKDLIDEEGWVPIYTKYVRDNIKDIISYKKYLIKIGVIECDNLYFINSKCLWYRWGNRYRNSEFKLFSVFCRYEDYVYDNSNDSNITTNEDYYLWHWYGTKNLTINRSVKQYAKAIYEYKKGNKKLWSRNANTNKLKNPLEQYKAALVNIDKIESHRYEVHRDDTVHRLHSVITNFQKDFRNFLTYDGKELVSIDVSNSQPYLSCLLFDIRFWQRDSNIPLTLYSLYTEIQNAIPDTVIDKVKDFLVKADNTVFSQYKEIVSRGKMYETIADQCNRELHETYSRKDAKILMFYLLFSSNQGQSNDITTRKMKTIFAKELYPEVAKLFKIIKHNFRGLGVEKQHNRLACLLQSIESEIILNRCCKRIWEEGNQQIPVFTIHDSIATTAGNENFVKNIMEEELHKAIGIKPTLKLEKWNIEEVEYKDILAQIIPLK